MLTWTNNQIENNIPRERPLGRNQAGEICVCTDYSPLQLFSIYKPMCASQGDFNQNCNELKSKLTEGGYKEEEID